jgi:hypothetical protein
MIKSIAGAIAVVGAAFLILDAAMMIPDVVVSYSTNECVEVVNYGSVVFGETNYSCENMPSRYNHVWAK